jgi:SAM-dependent methyltransferase
VPGHVCAQTLLGYDAKLGLLQALQAESYWDRFAAAYTGLGSPLRPSEEEVRRIEDVVREETASKGSAPVRALLLGATPDIARMNWPAHTSLIASDNSFPMAKGVWPGDIPGKRAVVCADWLSLPLRNASCDVVVGDGSINCLTYPDGFQALAESVTRVLRKPGLLVLRCYLQAEPRESAEQIHAGVLDGGGGSFHAFKLRLLMALQQSARAGVRVRDVYTWVKRNVDLSALSRRTGWTRTAVETIEYYQDAATVYAFPTLDELRSALSSRFCEVSTLVAGHEMGPRCPILVLRPLHP